MNYELAKQLQNAGFKKPENDEGYYWNQEGNPNDSTVYVPTLEELIEACGDTFTKLERRMDKTHGKVVWCAWCGESVDVNYQYAHGQSSTEAVALLWLKLHGL